MKSPIEYLETRLQEMYTEYERVLSFPTGGYTVDEKFYSDQSADLYKMRALITEYEKAVKDLKEIKTTEL